MTNDPVTIDQAIAWHLRQDDMSAADWADFVAWLEADPRHAAAYDAVSLADGLRHDAAPVATTVAPPRAANDDAPTARRWWLGGAAAAAVAAAVVAFVAPMGEPAGVRIVAGAQAPRQIALGDGTRIRLAPGAAMVIADHDRRVAQLDRGTATFTVRHDAAHPFVLRSGGWVIEDEGTVFEATRQGTRFSIVVREGQVRFDPKGMAVAIPAGRQLTIEDGATRAVATTTTAAAATSVAAPAALTPAALTFSNRPLGEVADEVGRHLNAGVTVAPALAGRRFTGLIRLTGVAERDVPHLAALAGVDGRREGDHWVMTPIAK